MTQVSLQCRPSPLKHLLQVPPLAFQQHFYSSVERQPLIQAMVCLFESMTFPVTLRDLFAIIFFPDMF